MTKKLLGIVIVLGGFSSLCLFIYLITTNKIVIGYNQGYMPDQPIPFSHELHAGQYKMDCRYCHTNTEVSRHASVPSLNICMNCHLMIDGNGSPHIAKIRESFNSKTPIEWNKVHLLPDHVKFNHASHMLAGKQCQECHGPVETMPVVYQWSSLSMGWCVNCHREPENNAPTTCSTCHY